MSVLASRTIKGPSREKGTITGDTACIPPPSSQAKVNHLQVTPMTSKPQRVLQKFLPPCLVSGSHPTFLKAPVPVPSHSKGSFHLGIIEGTALGLTKDAVLYGVIIWSLGLDSMPLGTLGSCSPLFPGQMDLTWTFPFSVLKSWLWSSLTSSHSTGDGRSSSLLHANFFTFCQSRTLSTCGHIGHCKHIIIH
ncbi:hypothetical protein XENTR_v10017366 [Xenopus tropicalis]|nr:hypothetical protein XENTR_v10017366 [Xenopus tropicalis]